MIKVPLWLRDYLKHDGSRELTGDWDIGNGRMIQADTIRARDGDGLRLFEDGGKGIFVENGGYVGIGTTNPGHLCHVYATTAWPVVRIESSGVSGGTLELVSSGGAYFIYQDGANLYFYDNAIRMALIGGGNLGIGTTAPGNPLAVNRSADGTIVDFESADTVEGSVSIAGNTTSYNTFMGSHYTQLKDGQKIPPVGAIVVATGEVITCEVNIEVPITERYYEDKIEVSINESLEDDIIEEQMDTGAKQTAFILINGKVIETKIPVLKTVKKSKGKKFKENFRLDIETGKVYKKIIKVLDDSEKVADDITVLERPKTKNGKLVTRIETKDVSGVGRKEYFSYVELASHKADKRVYGVYHAKVSDDSKGQSFGKDNKAVHLIAALGLYKVRVTDTNGDIAAGDYIQSSIRPGEGEKQDDDILHNYTVAKSIIDVTFSDVAVDTEEGYRWQLIPATLHAA